MKIMPAGKTSSLVETSRIQTEQITPHCSSHIAPLSVTFGNGHQIKSGPTCTGRGKNKHTAYHLFTDDKNLSTVNVEVGTFDRTE